MKTQNYKNHRKFVFGFQGVAFLLNLILIAGAIYWGIGNPQDTFISGLLSLTGVLLLVISFYARSFALKAQDRAIMAEENLRYYSKTQKLLPEELTYSQVVALRFAGDDEFLALVDKAVKEKLTSKQIKLEIKNWRANWYRV